MHVTIEQNRNRHPVEGRRPDALIGLVVAINRYMDHEINIVEGRRLILPVFALSVDDCAHRDLGTTSTGYWIGSAAATCPRTRY